ncbi:MAG: hypothetical protein KF862_27395 [Chitinophagaceae bacterium]|nr:hypothetical protein [Chitinophagaceae bacterium]
MRKLILVFFIALIAEDVSSQGDHFIYIQADNQQPFYVRSGSKTFYSSGEGYLVIPGLSSNNYELVVGFPDAGPVTEWRFDCTIGEKDLGFMLKKKGTAAPELINLGQKDGTAGIKMQVKEEKKNILKAPVLTGNISDDPFSKMLADVVNDPSIRQQPVIIQKKTEPVATAPVTADSVDKTIAAAPKQDSVNSPANVTAITENKPVLTKDSVQTAIAVAPKENKSTALKEPVVKTDSNLVKATTAKADSAGLANTTAAKQPDNQPFVVKEIKKEENTTVNTVPSAPPVAKTENKSFVLKETRYTSDKTSVQDSTQNTLAAQESKPQPVLPDTRPKEEPVAVAANNKPGTNDSNAPQKTLPFAVQPKEDPQAVKEQDEPGGKTSATGNSKSTAATAAPPKEASFAVKELPETDNKVPATGDQKTLPFSVQPQQEPFVLKETIGGNNRQPDKTSTTSTPVKNVVTSSVSIKKTLQRRSIDGIELIYVDEGENGAKDTIRILIPGAR